MEVLETELLQPSTIIAQVCSDLRIALNSILIASVLNLIPIGERIKEGLGSPV